jgi:sugar-specific transcriptional regulator TrmB
MTTHTLDSILQDLDLPPTSTKIYKDLLEHGQSPARTLSLRLRITRPSTYDHLAILKKKGLIIEKKIENKTYFNISDVHEIKNALQEKIAILTEHEEVFSSMLPALLKQSKSEAPVIKFFEGVAGLSHLLHDVLWSKGETIYTMWPHEEMQKVLGKETLIRFNDKRIRGKINVCALWPKTMKPASHEYIWNDKDVLTERRYTPKGIVWSMGYTIYGDKVSFISSHKEVFGFIVQSKEFALLMKLQFDTLWSLSKKS